MLQHIASHIFLTVLMYFFIFLCMRVMGKREIGKLSVFDLTISIMIAEIAVFVIDDIKRPIYDGITPMVTLVVIQIIVAQLSLKSRKLRLLIDGRPSVLISNGKLHRSEMRRQRYNMDDLLLQLRGQNIVSPADVEFAILETSGQLTVIEKNKNVSSSNQSGNSSDTAENEGRILEEVLTAAVTAPAALAVPVNQGTPEKLQALICLRAKSDMKVCRCR